MASLREKALIEYSSYRKEDAHVINDLALQNYVEMRASVVSPMYALRKWLEETLSVYVPSLGWQTKYSRSLVLHSPFIDGEEPTEPREGSWSGRGGLEEAQILETRNTSSITIPQPTEQQLIPEADSTAASRPPQEISSTQNAEQGNEVSTATSAVPSSPEQRPGHDTRGRTLIRGAEAHEEDTSSKS
ncbi:hypothetical protein G7Y89_g2707 [Cudoniella acicularis]|uniref:Uncharacterized protein n=1 Tax=Cudoniella acicularis TaxID=354080 RepID=A0A8H4RUL5_9HELO|nr:hypothetical protein G7Y89_g2707 [Cudoniella acicularis]